MTGVLANYTMPTVFDTLKPAASGGLAKTASAKTNAASNASSSSSSSSSADGADGLGSTFLSLLAQELQNQDPTAPVDPTAMVGQMISLNQLEQLISINQTITGSSTSSSTASGQAASAMANSAALSSASGGATSILSPSAAGAATSQLPFDPNTMMPLGFANTGAMAASIHSSVNPATMGFSATANNTSGGK
jgi:flagellar basal-body rod modification protein FlgD